MKKILFAILAGGLALTSCDMDQNAPGTLTDTEAVQTPEDVTAFRNNVYSSMRALTSGTYVTNTELEMDQFNQCLGSGGRGSRFAQATINASSSEITDDYQGCYSVMKNINFIIPIADNMIAQYNDLAASVSNPTSPTGAKLVAQYQRKVAQLTRNRAEIHFFRAYIYTWLFDHYCQSYTPAKADEAGLGVQIVTQYAPTGDTSKYPGRSTMNETFALINADLAEAYDGLKAYEAFYAGLTADDADATAEKNEAAATLLPNAYYVSSNTVAAMQARVALLTQDWNGAIAKAQEVINSGNYTLCTGADYQDMWELDEGDELIWVPFVNANESAYVGSLMDAWGYYANYPTSVDFAPSAATLNAYGTTTSARNKDIRFKSFFKNRSLKDPLQINAAQVTGYIFNKWPGNAALVSGTNYYKNKPKPFRLSEQYLIIAEAGAMSGQDAVALKALNDLRKARITGYTDASFSGEALVQAVQAERAKELIGEGFRMSDLRRWNLGMKRDGSNPGSTSMLASFVVPNLSIEFVPGDYRFVWPIPKDEMQINPQLAGQQNPGY